jgi:hypothetical protein
MYEFATHAAWNSEGGDFRANLAADAEVNGALSPEQLAACFATGLLLVVWLVLRPRNS